MFVSGRGSRPCQGKDSQVASEQMAKVVDNGIEVSFVLTVLSSFVGPMETKSTMIGTSAYPTNPFVRR